MGTQGWEPKDGSPGMGAQGWELGDRSLGVGAQGWEPGAEPPHRCPALPCAGSPGDPELWDVLDSPP